jgi:predicted kinase
MSKLIILRGNSGSGKSAVARKLAENLGSKVAIIAGDYYRQNMLFPIGECGDDVGELMAQNVNYCLSRGYTVFLDSIFYAHDVNKQYLGALLAKNGHENNYIFNFDVSFEETARRHQTRPLKDAFTVDQMKEWYKPVEPLGYDYEFTIPEHSTLEQTADFIRKTAKL